MSDTDIYQFDCHGKFLNKYNSITEVEVKTGISSILLTKYLENANVKLLNNFVWKFAKDCKLIKGEYIIDQLPLRICKFNLDGSFIDSYPDFIEASRKSKLNTTDIIFDCNTINSNITGYIWQFSTNCFNHKNGKYSIHQNNIKRINKNYKKDDNKQDNLRILALGDLHICVKNIREVNIYLEKLRRYLEEYHDSIDFICVVGDVLDSHERIQSTCLNKALEYAKMLTEFAPCYWLVGNHDMASQVNFLNSEHWMSCLKHWEKITVVDKILIDFHKDKKIVFCPYVPDGKFIEALNTRKGEWEDANCIFSHVTIKNCKMGSIIAKDADEWLPTYPMLISGHIHDSQWITDNMFYTGSILQVSVDEKPDKCIVLVDITNKPIKPSNIKTIDLELPKKKILYVDISEIEDYKIPTESDTVFTLYISGNYEQFRAFRKSNKYKELQKLPQIKTSKNIKFKPNKLETKERIKQIDDLQKIKQISFIELLSESIKQEKESTTMKLMLSLFNNLLDEGEDLSTDLENMLII